MARKKTLTGILIEVNGGVVTYVQFNGKPVAAYHIFDWDELLGDGDTRKAWEGLSAEEQGFIRDRYPIEFKAIQERLEEEGIDENKSRGTDIIWATLDASDSGPFRRQNRPRSPELAHVDRKSFLFNVTV